ncbi:MAG: hypothetical protein GXO69_00010 [Acidobacteria bacterium]|nr:hypothetical protein [Acidobacteriota bacterium]
MISDFSVPEFIFREFLLWLLVQSEKRDGSFELAGEYVSFRVEDQLKLEGEGDVRQTDLKKGVPSISGEAKSALQDGKLPTKMRVRLVVGGDEYLFVLDSKLMEIRGVKMPVVPLTERELRMEQRIFHLSQIYRMLELLFREFANFRLDAESWAEQVKEINRWLQEKPF